MIRFMRKASVVITLCFFTSFSQAAELNHSREYARCMGLAPSDPNDAFEMATAWKSMGGGDAAEHCAAVALYYSGKAEHAARRLEVLAETIIATPEFKGEILGQAGRAWLSHGDAVRAEATLTEAAKFLRGRPGILIDRSEARAALGDYKGAVEDLTNAILADASRAEAFAFRASAYRYLDELGKALLERGILFRLAENKDAARADWLKVLELDPDGEAGRLARANIEKMDVNVN